MKPPASEQKANVSSPKSASKIHLTIVIFGGVFGFMCIAGGLYAVLSKSFSDTTFDFWGAHLKTGSAGIALGALGLLVAYFVFKAVLKSLNVPEPSNSNGTIFNKGQEPSGDHSKHDLKDIAILKQEAEITDCGYIVLYRVITVHYITKTTGTTTHDIEIKATRDHESHYHGRYLSRGGKAYLTIKTPHKSLTLDPVIETGFQKFSVEFIEPLAKNGVQRLIMETKWEHPIQAQNPEAVMHILCPTGSLKFIVNFPDDLKASEAKGQIKHHPGVHMPISTEPIKFENQCLAWSPPDIRLGLAYRVFWKWV